MSKMLHDKYFQILEKFLGNYKKEFHGRSLIGALRLSPKAIALTLNELEQKSILKSRKQGNMKYFYLNLLNTEIKNTLQITELTKKINFLTKERKIAHLFQDDNRIVGIFGSYAKKNNKEHSDLDLFIIGKKNKEEYIKKGKTFDLEVSIKFFAENEFIKLLQNKNPLINEIFENYILLFNAERFIQLIWRFYYGFN